MYSLISKSNSLALDPCHEEHQAALNIHAFFFFFFWLLQADKNWTLCFFDKEIIAGAEELKTSSTFQSHYGS